MEVQLELSANLAPTTEGITTLNKGMTTLQNTATKTASILTSAFNKGAQSAKAFNVNAVTGINQIALLGEKVKAVGVETEKSGTKVRSYAQEIKAAALAAKELGDKFGFQSTQAIQARQRVADLKEDFDDFKGSIDAFNPERKFQVVSQLASGIAGGFAAAQGAIALFGSKSEAVEKVLLRVNSALALSQGLNAILGLGDTFKNLGALIGITTTATKAQAAAQVVLGEVTVGTTVATEGAAVATKSFTKALLTNPVFLIIAALTAAVAAFIAFSDSADDAAEKVKGFNKENEDFAAGIERLKAAAENLQKINDSIRENRKLTLEKELLELELSGAGQDKLLAKKKEVAAINAQLDRQSLEDAKENAKNLLDANAAQIAVAKKQNEELLAALTTRREIITNTGLPQIVTSTREFTDKEKELFEKNLEVQSKALEERKKLNTDVLVAQNQLVGQTTKEAIELDKIAVEKLEKEKENNAKFLQAKKEFADALADLERRANAATGEGGTAREKIEAQKRQADAELALLKSTLEKKAALAGKTLGSAQLEQLNQIQLGIDRKFNQEIENLEKEHQKTMLDIILDSSDRQLKEFELLFSERAKKLKEAGATEEEIAILHNRELNNILIKSTQERISLEAQLSIALINQRKRGGESQAEFEKQNALDIANVRLIEAQKNATALKHKFDVDQSEVNRVAFENAKAAVQAAKNGVDKAAEDLNKTQGKFSWSKLLGIEGGLSPDDEAKINEAVLKIGESVQSIALTILAEQQAIVDAQIAQNQQLIDSLNDRISQEQEALNSEIELKKAGYASNVEAKQKELAALKLARDKELAEQTALQQKKRQLAREQARIEAIQQAAGMITAGVNVFTQATAEGGLVGVILAIAGVAAMVASFLSFKSKVQSATETLGEGGWIDGRSHSEGGNNYVSTDGSKVKNIERGEFLTKKRQAKKYGNLLEAINSDNFQKLDLIDLKPLLEGTGAYLKDDVESGLTKDSIALQTYQINNVSTARLEKVEGHLVTIQETIEGIGKKLLAKEQTEKTPAGRTISKNGNVKTIQE